MLLLQVLKTFVILLSAKAFVCTMLVLDAALLLLHAFVCLWQHAVISPSHLTQPNHSTVKCLYALSIFDS